MPNNTPETKGLDRKAGLSPEEKKYLMDNDIKKVYESIQGEGRNLLNEIMNNIHMENKGKINNTFLSQVGLSTKMITDVFQGDIANRFNSVDKIGKSSTADRGIALVQALAENCIEGVGNIEVKKTLKSTAYFTSKKDIDGYMGPNTTLLLADIANSDLGSGSQKISFDGTITPELIAKMYKQCHPEFKPTQGGIRITPEQQKQREQSNAEQNKTLKGILEEINKLPPKGKLLVKNEWKLALDNVFDVVPTELTKTQAIFIQSQINYFDALDNQKEKEALNLVQNYTLEVQQGTDVLTGFEILKIAGKNDVEVVSPIAADGTVYKIWVINKNMPQPVNGIDQKLFQIQFKSDGKTLVQNEYRSSVEDNDKDGMGDFIYNIDNVGDIEKMKIKMYREADATPVNKNETKNNSGDFQEIQFQSLLANEEIILSNKEFETWHDLITSSLDRQFASKDKFLDCQNAWLQFSKQLLEHVTKNTPQLTSLISRGKDYNIVLPKKMTEVQKTEVANEITNYRNENKDKYTENPVVMAYIVRMLDMLRDKDQGYDLPYQEEFFGKLDYSKYPDIMLDFAQISAKKLGLTELQKSMITKPQDVFRFFNRHVQRYNAVSDDYYGKK